MQKASDLWLKEKFACLRLENHHHCGQNCTKYLSEALMQYSHVEKKISTYVWNKITDHNKNEHSNSNP
ncbi:CLUMA_CG001970, isoform A [Clunio marinus]|uniref:CLUMA_CG001970, isoform A n=1 Tax=Clunio marinus TaxID=568069 RepID=A0A1J1HJI9_9DIPT|nr:CLUMA_CG001970, isoform A [Clunio marinus]